MCIFLCADELPRKIVDVHLLLLWFLLFMWCEWLPLDVSNSERQASTVFLFRLINGVLIHNTCWNQFFSLEVIYTWLNNVDASLQRKCTKSIRNVCRQYFVIRERCRSRALICLSSKEDLHIFIQSKIFICLCGTFQVGSAMHERVCFPFLLHAFFSLMFSHLLRVTHLTLCASLCKLFPEVSMLLSRHEEMIFITISFFTLPLFLSFFSFLFKKTSEVQDLNKEESITNCPTWRITPMGT